MTLEWNVEKSLPPEIGMLGAPVLEWNLGTLGIAPIPWTDCWSPPGGTNPDDSQFVACHNTAYDDAREQCKGYNPNRYDSYDACVEQTKDVLIGARCLKFCKPSAAGYRGGDPCNSSTAIRYAQKQLGVTQDGKWGSNSTAALLKSGNTFQGLIGCTGACPPSVPAGACTGDCAAGFEIDPATGLCVSSGGGVGPAPCPDGQLRRPDGTCPPPIISGGKAKSGGAGLALLGFSALAAIAAAIIGAKS